MGEWRYTHRKRATQSSVLRSVMCCKLTLLPYVPIGPPKLQAGALASDGPWDVGPLSCRGEDPSPAVKYQPTFVFGVLLLCQRHLITRCTEQPDDDGHIRELYFSLACCLFERHRELEGKGSMTACVQRTDSLLQPKRSDSGRDKSYLPHNIYSATREAERSLLLWTANF